MTRTASAITAAPSGRRRPRRRAANPYVRAAEEIRSLTATPSRDAGHGGHADQQRRPPVDVAQDPCAAAPAAAVKMIAASEVAVATRASYASSPMSRGTITMPAADAEEGAEKSPAARPMTTRRQAPVGARGAVLGSPAVTVSDRRLARRPRAAPQPARRRRGASCDFDGTLAPIVPRPEDARLLDGAREAARGAARPGAPAGLRQRARPGRPRADGRHRRRAPTRATTAWSSTASATRPELAAGVAEHLRRDRGLRRGLARRAARGRGPAHGAQGGDAQRPRPRRARPRRGAGCCWPRSPRRRSTAASCRPPAARCSRCARRVAVDKGTAVRALLRDTGARAAMYIGDDRTDADAWRALRAMRDEGSLDATLGVAVPSGEVAARRARGGRRGGAGPAGRPRGAARSWLT